MVFENLLTPTGSRQLQFSRKALIQVGNAGGVHIAVDGQSIGPVGAPGMVQRVELLPGKAQLLPPDPHGLVCKVL
jgi:hypothetical protein